jgi:hypothetical protein
MIGGSFENNYLKTNTEPLKYGYTNFGIAPSFVMQKRRLDLEYRCCSIL